MHQKLLIISILFLLIISIGIWTQSQGLPITEPPIWNRITPAQTTRQEVESILGEPDKTWLCVQTSNTRSTLIYKSDCDQSSDVVHYGYYHEQLPGKSYGWYEIYFDTKDTVIYVVEPRWPDLTAKSMGRATFLAEYGNPERVTWSHRGGYARGLLYCEQGLILHVVLVHGKEDDRDIGISEVVYFTPMATDDCIDKFITEIATVNPYKGSHVEGSLDPWGFNSAEP